jgi:methanogenic corrinoid protein MtbC1
VHALRLIKLPEVVVPAGSSTESFRGQVGADGYSRNASIAVEVAKKLFGKVILG